MRTCVKPQFWQSSSTRTPGWNERPWARHEALARSNRPASSTLTSAGASRRSVAERLVEIAHAEQQNGVGMYCLDGVILLHQGRLDIFFVDFLFGSQNRILYNLYNKDRPFLNAVQSRHPFFFVCPAGSFRPSVRESRSRRTLCGKTPPSTPRDAGRPATRRACATASGRAPQRASARTPPRPVRRSP